MRETNPADGSLLPEPEPGIVRNLAGDGWYVLPVRSGCSPKPFFDVVFDGDAQQSYAAARAHNMTLRPFKTPFRNHKANRNDKSRPDLPVGVTLATRISINHGGKGTQLIYSFKVSRPGQKGTTVHIGTVNTWEHNYEKALEKAISVREKSKQALLK